MEFEPPDDIELELIESTGDVEAGTVNEGGADALSRTFRGELWYWRGPSPYHFITVPPGDTVEIQLVVRH